ncbi:MAG: response regulator transcription factor [Cyclobacteriaceae bacterium]|nr:response regulator transcription factor [Cyclobacteriaceae bacterium]
MNKVKILIADDHDLIHNGIKSILRPIKNYKIIGKAMNGEEAIQKAIELKPDIILMDISMPVMNGIEATRIISAKLPDIKILALTQHEENEYVVEILNSGGVGYLLKNSKKNEFVEAIETVLSGKKAFSKKISDQLISDLVYQTKDKENPEKQEIPLTKREIEIIRKIADDMSNQEIADELHISLRTVETHRRNLMQKLNVKTVVALLKYAAQHNIISFD